MTTRPAHSAWLKAKREILFYERVLGTLSLALQRCETPDDVCMTVSTYKAHAAAARSRIFAYIREAGMSLNDFYIMPLPKELL